MAGLIIGDMIISLLDIGFLAALLFLVQHRHTWYLPAVFFLLYCIKNAAGFLVYRAQCRFVGVVASRLSKDRLEGYFQSSFTSFVETDSSVRIRKTAHEPIEFCQHILTGIQQIFTQTALIGMIVIGLLYIDARTFIALVLILAPPVLLLFAVVRFRFRKIKVDSQKTMDQTLQFLQESLAGYVEGNVYGKEDFFLRRYTSKQRSFNRYFSNLLILQGIPNRFMELFVVLGLMILTGLGQSYTAGSGGFLTIGAFMAAAYKIVPGLVKLMTIASQLRAYQHTIDGLPVYEKTPVIQPLSSSPIKRVDFSNVSYSYGQKKIIGGLTFSMAAGDFVGLSGHSGKGKTTILHLLLGFLKPDTGIVMINGLPAGKSHYPHIAYVRQQGFLIHDTLLKNIVLDDDDPDWGRLENVIATTGLGSLIDSLPNGLSEILAENGRNISGGQRQRIAIARALYTDADLLLLDEPFNQLDAAAESQMIDHLSQLSQNGKLIMLISHNKDSLLHCNQIISLDDDQTYYAGHSVAGLSRR